jgi:hypothetical protein
MPSIKFIRRVGAASLSLPSLDHLVAPTMTLALAPAVLKSIFGPGWIAAIVFFISLGLFQLLWVGVLLKSDNSFLLVLGVLGNLISILIYFVSTAGVTLLDVPPQPLIAWGVFIKALETVFVLASVYVMRAHHTTT